MWQPEEAIAYYKDRGADRDQNLLIELLKEVCLHMDGIPAYMTGQISDGLGVKEAVVLALVKRIPALRLRDSHLLELCDGANCPKRAALGAFVEKTYGKSPKGFTWRYVPCMRLCGKGPNIKWDGKIYHGADEALIVRLVENKE